MHGCHKYDLGKKLVLPYMGSLSLIVSGMRYIGDHEGSSQTQMLESPTRASDMQMVLDKF